MHIDGDAGSVEVRFRVVRPDIARTLEVEQVDGQWRLTTTLAEPLTFHNLDRRRAERAVVRCTDEDRDRRDRRDRRNRRARGVTLRAGRHLCLPDGAVHGRAQS